MSPTELHDRLLRALTLANWKQRELLLRAWREGRPGELARLLDECERAGGVDGEG
jgi:signal transduction histidine kinase